MEPVLAVDIGGTKLAAALVTDDGRLERRRQVPTPPVDPFDALARLLREVVGSAVDRAPIVGVGVGCGGPMRWPEGVVSTLNIPSWREFPLRDRLEELFDGLPVVVHNDAVAFALGEHRVGAGRGADDMLGMVVSTGVGAGLVLGGQVRNGTTGNAGHLGHVVVEPDGPPCVCGGRGCLEAIARGPACVAWARERGFAGDDGPSLVAAAREGDAVATAALDRAGRAIGVALAGATALLDLDVVVIGGGMVAAGELLFGPLREALAVHARMPFTQRLRVLPAERPADAGLLGAAALLQTSPR